MKTAASYLWKQWKLESCRYSCKSSTHILSVLFQPQFNKFRSEAHLQPTSKMGQVDKTKKANLILIIFIKFFHRDLNFPLNKFIPFVRKTSLTDFVVL